MPNATLTPLHFRFRNIPWLRITLAAFVGLYILVIGASIATFPVWIPFVLTAPVFLPLFVNRSLQGEVSSRKFEILFFLFLVSSLLWPKILAIQIGGPDLRPQRLVVVLLVFVLVYAAMLPQMRAKLLSALIDNKFWFSLLFLLVLHRMVSCLTSQYFLEAIYRFINEFLTVSLIGIIVSLISRREDFINSYLKIMLGISMVLALMAVVEFALARNLFASIVLPGMQIDSEFRDNVVAAKLRGGTYRAQVTFTNPLQLTEYALTCLPLMLPLIWSQKKFYRISGVLGFMALLGALLLSGSRAGVAVAIGSAFLMAAAVQMAMLRKERSSWILWGGLGALTLLGFLALFWAAEMGYLNAIIGGRTLEERQSSEARLTMLRMAWPLIEASPIFGHGVGLAAFILGFRGKSGLTIDSYWLSYALDAGLLGLLLFTLVCVAALYSGIKQARISRKWHALCLYSLAVSVVSVLVFKTVLSLYDLDFLLFINLSLLATAKYWASSQYDVEG